MYDDILFIVGCVKWVFEECVCFVIYLVFVLLEVVVYQFFGELIVFVDG